jgi:IstB-like ATP binding protein
VVDAAYERRSVAVSSNLHPAGFDELMPKTLATATVDRLLHHAHVAVDGPRRHPPQRGDVGVGVMRWLAEQVRRIDGHGWGNEVAIRGEK